MLGAIRSPRSGRDGDAPAQCRQQGTLRAFFDKVEPTTLAILFDFAHDLG
jgi:hypothetical protein